MTGSSFSLVARGPAHHVLRALHVADAAHVDAPRASALFVLITWVPIVTLGLVELFTKGQVPAFLTDASVHIRPLVTMPLLFVAEGLLARRCASAVNQLLRGRFVAPTHTTALDRILGNAEKRAGSWLAELALLALAFVGSQATMWGVIGRTGLFGHVEHDIANTAAYVWYTTILLPIYQFFFLRWLWRWVIWSTVVVRIARLDVRPEASHPDRAGGLGRLVEPNVAFATFMAGASAMVTGSWCTQVVVADAHVVDFAPRLVLLALCGLLVGFGPLCAFTRRLYRARLEAERTYTMHALTLVRLFDERSLRQVDESLLEKRDIGTMADLDRMYEGLQQQRLSLFGLRDVAVLLTAVALPVLPVLLLDLHPDELLVLLGRALLDLSHLVI